MHNKSPKGGQGTRKGSSEHRWGVFLPRRGGAKRDMCGRFGAIFFHSGSPGAKKRGLGMGLEAGSKKY